MVQRAGHVRCFRQEVIGVRSRARITFSKRGGLRFLGHRDLVRLFERMLRRTGMGLALSQGFHPKAKLSFPLALALGIEGHQESLDVEFSEPVDADELSRLLQAECPDGLTILKVVRLPEEARKARPAHVQYALDVPESRHAALTTEIDAFMALDCFPLERPGRKKPIDARADIESLRLQDKTLHWTQRVTATASVQPREIVKLLGLQDLLDEGTCIARTNIHWDGDNPPPAPTAPQNGAAAADACHGK